MANHLILALDEETKKWCEEHGINAYLLALQVHKSQEGTGKWAAGGGGSTRTCWGGGGINAYLQPHPSLGRQSCRFGPIESLTYKFISPHIQSAASTTSLSMFSPMHCLYSLRR